MRSKELAQASNTHGMVIYKLEDDLRSQFGLYKSSHRCRVGCYSVVYPMHLDHFACAEYCTSNAEMDGQSSWQDARW
jgi:hypothetical protein